MNKIVIRFLSTAIVFCLLLGAFPVSALAWGPVSDGEGWTDPRDNGSYSDSETAFPDTLDLAANVESALAGLLSSNPSDADLGAVINAVALARNMSGNADGLGTDADIISQMLAYLEGYPVSGANANTLPLTDGMLALISIRILFDIQDAAAILNEMYAGLPSSAYDAAPRGQTAGGLVGYGDNMLINGTAVRAMAGSAGINDAYGAALLASRVWNLPKNQSPIAVHGPDLGKFDGQISSYAAGLLGLLYYAEAASASDVMNFVRASYEYVRSFGISSIGLFGDIDATGYMTMLAVKLSLMGVGDYWDDVEMYVRNELAEKQDAGGLFQKNSGYPGYIKAENQGTDITTTAIAVHALYSVWDSIITGDKELAVVNLPLNRTSALLDVKSYLPYEGKIELDIKTAENVAVRIPKWANMSSVSVSGASFTSSGNLVLLSDLSSTVTVTFGIREWSRTYSLKWNAGDDTHTCITPAAGWRASSPINEFDVTFRGYTAIRIAPAITNSSFPAATLYKDREDFSGTAPTKMITPYSPFRTLTTEFEKGPAKLIKAVTTIKDFVSIQETAKNSRVWVLTFMAELTYSDGTTKVETYSISLNGNNANLDGKYTFKDGHDLAGYTLVYDVKGNGSNIKDLRLTR